MMGGRKTINGISILDAAHLIPFKMYAWTNLLQKKAQRKHVNEKDIKKHKYDVFRLLEIVPNNTRIFVEESVHQNIEEFLSKIQVENLELSQIGVTIKKEQAIEIMRSMYLLAHD